MGTMALYLIGDVQGCDDALARLLAVIDFSPSRDELVLLGDLVNRGPDSLGVLRRMMGLEGAARCVLGNHDLHLLALAHGVRPPHRKDTLNSVLHAPDRDLLLGWLRTRPLALLDRIHGQELLMVHAGVLPSWTAHQTLALAQRGDADDRQRPRSTHSWSRCTAMRRTNGHRSSAESPAGAPSSTC